MRAVKIVSTGLAAAALMGAAPPHKAVPVIVVPATARPLAPISLGQLIVLALPKNRTFAWDALQIPQVRWLTNGISYGQDYSYRDAVARVRALGETSRILQQSWVEVAWRIELGTEKNEKFGPTMIQIQPGLDGDLSCFGVTARGCTFSPSAMQDPKLNLHEICLAAHRRVFSARSTDGRFGTVAYVQDAGSGGETDSVEISAEAPAAFCEEHRDS